MLMRKNKIIELLRRVVDNDSLIDVNIVMKRESIDYEVCGMFGHEPGHYTVYGGVNTTLKIDLSKLDNNKINKLQEYMSKNEVLEFQQGMNLEHGQEIFLDMNKLKRGEYEIEEVDVEEVNKKLKRCLEKEVPVLPCSLPDAPFTLEAHYRKKKLKDLKKEYIKKDKKIVLIRLYGEWNLGD